MNYHKSKNKKFKPQDLTWTGNSIYKENNLAFRKLVELRKREEDIQKEVIKVQGWYDDMVSELRSTFSEIRSRINDEDTYLE